MRVFVRKASIIAAIRFSRVSGFCLLDFAYIFFLVGERELRPRFPGLRLSSNYFLQIRRQLDLPLIFVELHDYVYRVAAFAFATGSQLSIHDHHMAISHVHQRAAERKTVDFAFDRHASLTLEDFDHVERWLERGDFRAWLGK